MHLVRKQKTSNVLKRIVLQEVFKATKTIGISKFICQRVPDVAKFILYHCCSQKEKLDCANEGGWTPLMYASYIGHELVVQQLLEAGVSVNSTNNKGQSPLALATSCGNDKTAELLIKVRCGRLALMIIVCFQLCSYTT